LIVEYENTLAEIIAGLTSDNCKTAIELASLPLQIRGYGYVKTRAIEEVKAEQQRLEAEFRKSADESV